MREVIEKPAARAGLTFEVRDSDGKSLAEELAAANRSLKEAQAQVRSLQQINENHVNGVADEADRAAR
jgi:hypothetical protein